MWNFGDTVKVKAFMEGIGERRVIGSGNGKVYVCSESEFLAAQNEDREALAIGFPVEHVVGSGPLEPPIAR